VESGGRRGGAARRGCGGRDVEGGLFCARGPGQGRRGARGQFGGAARLRACAGCPLHHTPHCTGRSRCMPAHACVQGRTAPQPSPTSTCPGAAGFKERVTRPKSGTITCPVVASASHRPTPHPCHTLGSTVKGRSGPWVPWLLNTGARVRACARVRVCACARVRVLSGPSLPLPHPTPRSIPRPARIRRVQTLTRTQSTTSSALSIQVRVYRVLGF
jgi:hypothetical protein